ILLENKSPLTQSSATKADCLFPYVLTTDHRPGTERAKPAYPHIATITLEPLCQRSVTDALQVNSGDPDQADMHSDRYVGSELGTGGKRCCPASMSMVFR
ncbi:hypothetical protein GOODEAATRI_004974, partial [Goodea atripinnis]